MKSKKLSPLHPGEIFREEFLVLLKMKPGTLAQEINVSAKVIKEICEIICRLVIYF